MDPFPGEDSLGVIGKKIDDSFHFGWIFLGSQKAWSTFFVVAPSAASGVGI